MRDQALARAQGRRTPSSAARPPRCSGAHPGPENIRPLLALRQATPEDDTHLIHVVRMALRDQLRPAEAWPSSRRLGLTERDRRDLADVAPGVPSPEAAAFLLGTSSARSDEGPRTLVRFVHHIARYGDEGADAGSARVRLTGATPRAGGQARAPAGDPAGDPGARRRPGRRLRKAARRLRRTLLRSSDPADEVVRDRGGPRLQFRDELPELQGSLDRPIADARPAPRPSRRSRRSTRRCRALLGRMLDDAAAPLELREKAAISWRTWRAARGQALVSRPCRPPRPAPGHDRRGPGHAEARVPRRS